jgi:hypothetical protein
VTIDTVSSSKSDPFEFTVKISVRPSVEKNGYSCERSARAGSSVVTATAGESPLAATFQMALA